MGSRLGHVLRRVARPSPVLQCPSKRREGASRRRISHVKKAASRPRIAKSVAPADRGPERAPPLLCRSIAKSSKIALMVWANRRQFWHGFGGLGGRLLETIGLRGDPSGDVRGSGWCDLGRLLGHVLGRMARPTPVLQCQIERRGGASRRLFWEVEKATLGSCIAKSVTPADRGPERAPPLLCRSIAKSSKIALMTID